MGTAEKKLKVVFRPLEKWEPTATPMRVFSADIISPI